MKAGTLDTEDVTIVFVGDQYTQSSTNLRLVDGSEGDILLLQDNRDTNLWAKFGGRKDSTYLYSADGQLVLDGLHGLNILHSANVEKLLAAVSAEAQSTPEPSPLPTPQPVNTGSTAHALEPVTSTSLAPSSTSPSMGSSDSVSSKAHPPQLTTLSMVSTFLVSAAMARPLGPVRFAIFVVLSSILGNFAIAAPVEMPTFILPDIVNHDAMVSSASLIGKPCLFVLNQGN